MNTALVHRAAAGHRPAVRTDNLWMHLLEIVNALPISNRRYGAARLCQAGPQPNLVEARSPLRATSKYSSKGPSVNSRRRFVSSQATASRHLRDFFASAGKFPFGRRPELLGNFLRIYFTHTRSACFLTKSALVASLQLMFIITLLERKSRCIESSDYSRSIPRVARAAFRVRRSWLDQASAGRPLSKPATPCQSPSTKLYRGCGLSRRWLGEKFPRTKNPVAERRRGMRH